MNNGSYKDAMSKITVPKDLEQQVLNLTVNKERNIINMPTKNYGFHKIPRLAAAICAVVLIGSLTAGAVFADDIREFFGKATLSDAGKTFYTIADIAAVDINDTSIQSRSSISMTVAQAEQMLGVDILTTDKATTDVLAYSTLSSEDKIARVDLWYADFIEYDNKQLDEASASAIDDEAYQSLMAQGKWISLSVAFVTDYADEGFVSSFESGIDAGGGKIVGNAYRLDNIDADAVFYTNNWSDTRLQATFVHNNMLYIFIGNNISEGEMLEILQSLR